MVTRDTLNTYIDWITCPACRVMRPLGDPQGCPVCRRNSA